MSAALNYGEKSLKVAAAQETVIRTSQHEILAFGEDSVTLGLIGRDGFQPLQDQSAHFSATAVKVDVATAARLMVLRMLLSDDGMNVQRSAVATLDPPRISFALFNCLLSLRLLDPILRPVLGARVDVLCSGRGIDTRVEILPFLETLAVEANLLTPSGDPVSYGEVLDANLPAAQVLSAETGAVIPDALGTIRLDDILYLPPDLRSLQVGAPLRETSIDLSEIVFAVAEVLASRVADLRIGLDLGEIGNVGASVRVGDPRKIVLLAVPGDPNAVARTSQIEIELDAIDIAGLFRLGLRIGVANATARLSDRGQACNLAPDETVAVFDPVDATLLDTDLAVHLPGPFGGSLPLSLRADTVSQRETRSVTFTRAQYENDPIRVIAPSGSSPDDTAVSALRDGIADALQGPGATARGGGVGNLLGGTLSGLLGGLTQTAANVANAIGAEGTLTNAILEDLVGLGIARAELELLDVRCGARPRLIMSGESRLLPVVSANSGISEGSG